MIDPSQFNQLTSFYQEPYNRNEQINPVLMSEATYYGKSEKLAQCEKILDEMVVLGHKPGGTVTAKFTDKMYDVAEILRQVFGFNSFQINNSVMFASKTIVKMMLQQTGCTLCHADIVKYTKVSNGEYSTWVVDFDDTHKGVQFKPGTIYNMRMFLSLSLFMENGVYNMTGSEILAIILHEIGHSFYVGPIRECGSTLLACFTAPDLIKYVTDTVMVAVIIEGTNYIDAHLPEPVRKIIMRFDNILSTVLAPLEASKDLIHVFKEIWHLFLFWTTATYRLATTPLEAIRNFLRYDPEKYSDAFAASYGYGNELSTALLKANHFTVAMVPMNQGTSDMFDLFMGVYKFLISTLAVILDCHPNTVGRLNNNIKYMEAAGEKITDPHLKKEYQAQMKALYATKNAVINYSGNNMVSRAQQLSMMIEDFTKITDIKDLTSSLKPTMNNYMNLDYTIN